MEFGEELMRQFGRGCFYHIEAVVKNAELLELVQRCIRNHRGSINSERISMCDYS